MKTMSCPRCEGKGYISAFNHVAAGTCFRCKGAKVVAFRAAPKTKPAPALSENIKIEAICGGTPFINERAREYFGFSAEFLKTLQALWNAGVREIKRAEVIR